MYRLVDVSLAVLSRDPDYPNNAQGTLAIIPQWQTLMGPIDPMEVDMQNDPLAWFLYAYTVVKYAIDHLPNPTSAASLRQSRQWILSWAHQPQVGPQAHVMLAALPANALPSGAPRKRRGTAGKKGSGRAAKKRRPS